ncbi:RNA 3'-phosphate cyclase [Nitzschia inconspicua]|uniref:RNA 3'-phosphate cyclase n=1 Tax=Nitzschia inconspicua TaxID=303405 RepID=A0A9K3KIK7_9STRA|nr:RNA 3'-phosphate cyclase [Nitzschia inconspicua]
MSVATKRGNDQSIRTIDGSYGEGGGQLIRNACAYASILQQNICLTNIREGRKPKPGLRPQHLVGLQILAEACGGKVASAQVSNTGKLEEKAVAVGANKVLFLGAPCLKEDPNNERKKRKRSYIEIVGDTQTAGSVCLLLQAVLPFALFSNQQAEYKLILKGGTNATMAPPIDYFERVFLPTLLKQTNLPENCIQANVITRGFYPKGGGHVEVTVRPPVYNNDSGKPWTLSSIQLTERGVITEIVIRAFAAGTLHASVAKRLATVAKTQLENNFATSNTKIIISTDLSYYPNAVGGGCGLLLVAKTSNGNLLGASGIGSPKVPLEDTARQATAEMIDILRSGACVDDYLQDQLVLYMALAQGTSEVITDGVTLHTRTAIWLAEQLCKGARFEVTKLDEDFDNVNGQSDDAKESVPKKRVTATETARSQVYT